MSTTSSPVGAASPRPVPTPHTGAAPSGRATPGRAAPAMAPHDAPHDVLVLDRPAKALGRSRGFVEKKSATPILSHVLAKRLRRAKASLPARTPARTPAAAPRRAPSTGYATSSSASGGEWAFLDDKSLSIDEKLFRFMAKLSKKMDDTILKKMKEMRGETSSTASRSGSTPAPPAKRGGGIFGGVLDAVKAVVAPLGFVDKLLGESGMDALLKSVTGPVLAAGATALGMPQLAPLLLSIGPQAGGVAHGALHAIDGLVDGVAGSAAGGGSPSGAGGAKSSGAAPGTYDQMDLLELQRLTEKQKEMMTAISNTLRALHDMRMSAIQNIR